MATSERILTVAPGTAGLQRVVPSRFLSLSRPPAWLQAFADYGTIIAGLKLIEHAVQEGIFAALPSHLPSRLALAMMLTIMLAFAGAYPPYETPLNIAGTVGTIRAVTCIATLTTIAGFSLQDAGLGALLPAIAFISVLLLLQRELLNGLLRRRSSRHSSVESISEACYAGDFAIHGTRHQHVDGSSLLKRFVDLTGAVVLLALSAPLGIAVATLIRLDSRGPIFIRQRRIGRDGEAFDMWKFRSMYVDAPLYARSPTSDCDPRLTKLGRSLRRLSLDELPQLWNVIRGEMSLVGPRPEMPFIVKQYSAYERLRLNATPGITGLWQISAARAMPIHKNVELDLYYIDRRSFFLDCAILLRTLTAVVRGIGAK